jgi:hypothetical protein
LKFDSQSRKSTWEDGLECYIYNPKERAKSFYSFASGCLVFNHETLEICRTIFEMCGEILRIELERGGGSLYLKRSRLYKRT